MGDLKCMEITKIAGEEKPTTECLVEGSPEKDGYSYREIMQVQPKVIIEEQTQKLKKMKDSF